MTLRSRILLYLVTALAVFTHHALASVLAIDYGADWIKASLMKPGVPFDVLLNRDSKRKIQSSVGWKGDDRLFGGDAANAVCPCSPAENIGSRLTVLLQAGRFPQDSFSSLKFLQAAPYDAQVVEFFASISTGEAVQTSRGTVALRRKDGTMWAVEELVAMQLAYVKDLAEGLAGERVSDVVVTVPPFYSQFERDAVADAVEIAGLRTLALVNDGTAVAVNYAMTRTFAAPEYHVMYDAGASSIRATVVQLETVEGNKKKKTGEYTQITIVGVGYDRTVGGTELDRRVRDLLLADFQQKHKKDLREDKRGMARLWKEASRVKSILSANADSRVTVESIAWDIDYKSKMSREQFENACADLKPKFIEPITEAIANAGLTLVCAGSFPHVHACSFTAGPNHVCRPHRRRLSHANDQGCRHQGGWCR
jgi:hypoxia up-regulated 1